MGTTTLEQLLLESRSALIPCKTTATRERCHPAMVKMCACLHMTTRGTDAPYAQQGHAVLLVRGLAPVPLCVQLIVDEPDN